MKQNDDRDNLPNRHQRKPNRLSGYDYSTPGYYFITICTADHEPHLGRIFACNDGIAAAEMVLNEIGRTVENAILDIPAHYPGTTIDKYVVMPNHIHLILMIPSDLEKRQVFPGSYSSSNAPSRSSSERASGNWGFMIISFAGKRIIGNLDIYRQQSLEMGAR